MSKSQDALAMALLGGAAALVGAAATGIMSMLSQGGGEDKGEDSLLEREMLDEPSPAYDSHGNTEAPAEHQHHQTDKNNQDCGKRVKLGGQEAGGSNGRDTGGEQERGNAGGQRSNNDKEDDDNDEEDDDNDEEDSDSTYQLSTSEDVAIFSDDISDSTSQSTISELVDSSSYDISDSTSQLSISEHRESSSDFSSESTLQLRTSEGEMLIGLFNSRSINNNQSRISELINRFNLSALMLTETWVTPENGDQRLREISGEFDVFHQPRVNQEGESERGGGVAILSSNDLRGTRVRFEDTFFEYFEYVAAELQHDQWDRPIWTVTVYRPPRGNDEDMRKFLDEFQKLLDKFSKDDSILITGDFNIWVNDKNNKHAKWFKELLEANGLRQHVREPTHNKGNTLDLVITRNVHISTARVKKPKKKTKTVIDKQGKKTKKNITLSDHSAVLISVRPKKPTDPPSKQPKDRKK